jgi:hypothetical protein
LYHSNTALPTPGHGNPLTSGACQGIMREARAKAEAGPYFLVCPGFHCVPVLEAVQLAVALLPSVTAAGRPMAPGVVQTSQGLPLLAATSGHCPATSFAGACPA